MGVGLPYGAPPPSLLVQFGLGGEGARGLLWQPLPLLHIRPIRPINPPGGSGNPPVLQFYPKLPKTLPVSEYSRPVYHSLCLDHFETPRHVRDHIRDSELTSVHQNA